MSFQIKPASRVGVKPLVGFYGKSGSGKTLSALLMARGIAGPNGKIVLVDSESGRGSIFVDLVIDDQVLGKYDVIDLDPPFSPDRYQEAIELAESSASVVVVDSLSHSWAGEGGVLDMQETELARMAGDNWQKRESCKMASWIKPKMEHKKFVQRLLRLKCALICCLRGEEKTHMVRGEDGKNKVVTDEFSSPLYDPRFIFELLLNFETVAHDGKGGFVVPRKVTHPDITRLLPGSDQQISIAHGQALARWCAAPTAAASVHAAVAAVTEPKLPTKVLKKQLWDLTQGIHGGNAKSLEQWLWDEAIISDTESLAELTVERLPAVIKAAQDKLAATAAAQAAQAALLL